MVPLTTPEITQAAVVTAAIVLAWIWFTRWLNTRERRDRIEKRIEEHKPHDIESLSKHPIGPIGEREE
jgi:hypothetical protein